MRQGCRFWQISALAMLSSSYALAMPMVTGIRFQPDTANSRLVIEHEGATQASIHQDERTKQLVVNLPGMQLPANLTRIINLAAQNAAVIQITPYNTSVPEAGARIVLQLREKVNFTQQHNSGSLVLQLRSEVGSTSAGMANEAAILRTNTDREPRRIQVAKAWIETDSLRTGSSAEAKGEKSVDVARQLEETLNSDPSEKVYHGNRVNFEASDANVHDILRLVGAASGLNIISASDVVGKVNVALKDVPWDQLLDVILQELQLRIAVLGNIVRVISAASYNKELDEKKKALALNTALEPTIMAIVPISYAKADEMKKMIDTFLVKAAPASAVAENVDQAFERGKIEIDQRSNSLIITNTAKAIERIRKLLKELDVPMPQILIESKIVVATETFAKNLSVNWGANQYFGARKVAGGSLSFNGGTASSGAADGSSAFSVATGGLGDFGAGVALGAGSMANINVKLSLGEANALAKTVASPKIIVNNKQAATINDTQTAAYKTQTTSQGGVANETKFVSLPLTLSVTPQITNAGSVLLDLSVSKASLDNPETGSSNVKSLQTQVLVDSGSTLVLGGVYQYNTGRYNNGIPFLKDLPILGALFRTTADNENKSELMVFVTPKILETGASGISSQL